MLRPKVSVVDKHSFFPNAFMPSYISFTLVFDSAVVASYHAVPLQNVQTRTRIPTLCRNRE